MYFYFFYIFRIKKLKRKVSFKWYISKLNQAIQRMTTSILSNLYSNCCNINNMNNHIINETINANNKNNDMNTATPTPTENDDNSKKELQNHQHNKLVSKLGKLNVSKPTNVIPETETIQNNENEQKMEIGRNKSTEYYYKHREEKLEYQKNYNREKGDAIKDYNKNYYMKRRKEILEKAKTKVTCECGCVVQLFNMNSHKKTKKHIRYLEMGVATTNAFACVDTSV